jgi:hypothetical protein
MKNHSTKVETLFVAIRCCGNVQTTFQYYTKFEFFVCFENLRKFVRTMIWMHSFY